MKKLKIKDFEFTIDIKVKSTKIEVKETSTYFQRVCQFVMSDKKILQQTKTAFFSELNNFISEARSQYDKIRSEAWSQYDKIRSEARSQYDKIDSEARSQYDKIDSEARSQYDKKVTKKVKELIVKFKINFKE